MASLYLGWFMVIVYIAGALFVMHGIVKSIIMRRRRKYLRRAIDIACAELEKSNEDS